ncbi:unnamed protein product [Mytilus coruscus]|uniref:Uncharacterized protein n=1 Tax=Mytilus coruscus TaxID=42192 RepID=A0A6J8AZH8_MYTCO|nr:unnamed protein product [Mytilus coruscus]
MRLPYTVFESRVSHTKVLEVHDVEQSVCPPMLLWPRSKFSEEIDEYLDPTVPDPDNHTYKHYVHSLLSTMWNSAIKKHAIQNYGCDGDLDFDYHAAHKMGIYMEGETKMCNMKFYWSITQIFHGVNLPPPGRKAATINMGIQAGLMTTTFFKQEFSRHHSHM